MLARRIQRDVKERRRSVEGVIEQYVFSTGGTLSFVTIIHA
jgi:uridine kinase